jgi:hypothetical protein
MTGLRCCWGLGVTRMRLSSAPRRLGGADPEPQGLPALGCSCGGATPSTATAPGPALVSVAAKGSTALCSAGEGARDPTRDPTMTPRLVCPGVLGLALLAVIPAEAPTLLAVTRALEAVPLLQGRPRPLPRTAMAVGPAILDALV